MIASRPKIYGEKVSLSGVGAIQGMGHPRYLKRTSRNQRHELSGLSLEGAMIPKHALKLLAIVDVFWGMPLIATAAPSKGDPAAGQKIVAGSCEICHGPTGRGEDSSMPVIC